LWLCGVTEFVYGYMPKMLAVRVGDNMRQYCE